MAEINFWFPRIFRRRVSFPRGRTIFGQGSPCERQYGQLHTLLQSQLGQEEVGRRRDHVLQFGDKEIEGWRGIRHEFSMWAEGEVGT